MSVAAKLNKVMEKVNYLKKDGKVSYGSTNYGYLSEEKIVSELNEAFREVGLVITPVEMDIVNTQNNIVQIKVKYKIYDSEDNDSITVTTIGEGQDKGDKKCNKAMTAAYKYALRQSLMIATGDDPDHTASEKLNNSKKKNNFKNKSNKSKKKKNNKNICHAKGCNEELSENVVSYCRSNKDKFDGHLFCRKHQKAYKKQKGA